MKNKYLLLLSVLSLTSCTVDEHEEDKPVEVKFPFKELDKTYFNQTSNNLQVPTENLRLDSIVDYVYFRYDPNTGISSYYGNKSNTSLSSPPPPRPTGRITQVFTYNTNNRIERIDSFDNSDSDELTKKGTFGGSSHFFYDTNNNLIKRGFSSSGSFQDAVYHYEYIYANNKLITEKYKEGSYNGTKDFVYKESLIEITNKVDNNLSSTEVINLDSFNNITTYNRKHVDSTNPYVITYRYPKNIINPYNNLFPQNFHPFLVLGSYNGGFSHFSSGTSENFHSKIQLNSNFYPEIVESGSYDEGYRTKYYYSKIN